MPRYQVGDSCFDDAVAAANVATSLQVGQTLTHSGKGHVVSVTSITATSEGQASVSYRYQPVDGGASITFAAPYYARPCGRLDWDDGITLGWAVVLVWVSSFGVLFLARALGFRDQEGEA